MKKVALAEAGRIASLRRLSYMLGRCLAVFGWMLFTVGILFSSLYWGDSYFLASDRSYSSQILDAVFVTSGLFIVPGWLLLRFAVGLFPFSWRVFK